MTKKKMDIKKYQKKIAARSRTVKQNEENRLGIVRDEITHIDGNGTLTEGDFIYLEGKPFGTEFTGVCTCGDWRHGPSEKIIDIGRAAKLHYEATGHKLRGM
jgi:hypothetical protein